MSMTVIWPAAQPSAIARPRRSYWRIADSVLCRTCLRLDWRTYYLNIVEFASYEAAMENSSRPEIGEFAARLAKLCDSPPKFHNLDVREVWQSSNPT